MKGILLSLMAILLVSGMMGVAYAKSDSPNKQNDFSHHKIDLKLKDQDERWQDGVSETWVVTNMALGDEFAFDESFVELRGKLPKKVDMGNVNINCNYAVDEEFPQTEADTDPNTDSDPDSMAKYMVITRGIYKFTHKKEVWQIDLLTGELTVISGKKAPFPDGYINDGWQIQDFDGDGKVTFYDLKWSPVTNLPLPRKGKGTRFEMSVKFHEDAGNDFQGDTFNLTMIYTLTPGKDWKKGLSK